MEVTDYLISLNAAASIYGSRWGPYLAGIYVPKLHYGMRELASLESFFEFIFEEIPGLNLIIKKPRERRLLDTKLNSLLWLSWVATHSVDPQKWTNWKVLNPAAWGRTKKYLRGLEVLKENEDLLSEEALTKIVVAKTANLEEKCELAIKYDNWSWANYWKYADEEGETYILGQKVVSGHSQAFWYRYKGLLEDDLLAKIDYTCTEGVFCILSAAVDRDFGESDLNIQSKNIMLSVSLDGEITMSYATVPYGMPDGRITPRFVIYCHPYEDKVEVLSEGLEYGSLTKEERLKQWGGFRWAIQKVFHVRNLCRVAAGLEVNSWKEDYDTLCVKVV